MRWQLHRKAPVVALLAVLMCGWGCGDVLSGKQTRLEETVGPEGRTMELENLAVTIPEGALAEEVNMVIFRTADHPEGNIGPVYGLKVKKDGAWYDDGFKFAKPLELTLGLPLARTSGLDDYKNLRLAWVEEGEWSLLETSLPDPDTESITGIMEHLGTWGVVMSSEPACVPHCEDKKCGSDGCEGTCGECDGAQEECSDGLCTCIPHCVGRECGDDGCGGECGECGDGYGCNVDGLCQPADPDCGDKYANSPCYFEPCMEPSFGVCLLTACGAVGTEQGQLDLGEVHDLDAAEEGIQVEVRARMCQVQPGAPAEMWVDGGLADSLTVPADDDEFKFPSAITVVGGAEPQCVELKVTVGDALTVTREICTDFCVPDCDDKECGADGCGGDCGPCDAEYWECDEGKGVCVCVPDCSCDGGGEKSCGPDGCGGECGECPEDPCDEPCEPKQCLPPECDGKECGSDGMGGSCGECADTHMCIDSQCVDGCELVDPEGKTKGCCANNMAYWCDNGHFRKWDCSAPSYLVGTECEVPADTYAAEGFYRCNTKGDAPVCEELVTGPCSGPIAVDPGDETDYCPWCVGNCEGKECGKDGCGNLCGSCPAGATCAPHGICVFDECYGQCCAAGCNELAQYCANPEASQVCNEDEGLCLSDCNSDCIGRACGPSGCGGHCGLCKPGEMCILGTNEAICQPCD